MVTVLKQRCENWLNLEYIIILIRNDDKIVLVSVLLKMNFLLLALTFKVPLFVKM